MFRIAVDVGGSTIRVALFRDFQLCAQKDFAVTNRPEIDVQRIIAAARGLAEGQPIAAAGLAVAGKLDESRRTLLAAGNLDGWNGYAIADTVEEALQTRISIGNDAEAGAMADALNIEVEEDFYFIIWGTGIGGALVRYDGDGPRVFAAEPGHQLLRGEQRCKCKQQGCLELHVGGGHLHQRFGVPPEEMLRSQWMHCAKDMSAGLRNILSITPVSLMIFGGGVSVKQQWLLRAMALKLENPMLGSPRLQISRYGERAGVHGALALTYM